MPAAWVSAIASIYGATQKDSSKDTNKAAGEAAKTGADIALAQWKYYSRQFEPLETSLIDQAAKAGSPEEYARAEGAANADVTHGFDDAKKNTEKRLQAYGINPGSPAYQSALASADIAEGATKAGALTAADNSTRNLAYSKALDVVGIGRNIPAQSAASATNSAKALSDLSRTQYAQNSQNTQNTGYAVKSVGNAATKWFNSDSTNSNPNYNSNGTVGDPTGYGTYSTTDPAYGAKGGKVSKDGIGDPDVAVNEDEYVPQRRGSPEGRSAGGTRNYADGGAVIDAEKTGDDSYDATALKGVLESRGLNPRVAHSQAHGTAARHRSSAITPHMRHSFASGGGVGRQGLEGPDASDMGKLQGPGTETSDGIPAEIDGEKPAALSTGEVVVNADAVKLTGDEILQAINEAGLKKRQAHGLEPQASNDVSIDAGEKAYAEGGNVETEEEAMKRIEAEQRRDAAEVATEKTARRYVNTHNIYAEVGHHAPSGKIYESVTVGRPQGPTGHSRDHGIERKTGYADGGAVGDDEREFQSWYAKHAKERGLNPNPDDPQHHYDYRSAYRAGARPDSTGHWPSEYKREGHPRTFINEETGETSATSQPGMRDTRYASGGRVARYGLGG